MDIKKTEQLSKPANAQPKEAAYKAGQWKDALGNLKAEFAKINWTDSDELRAYTKIVVAATFLFGMGVYLMDIAIQLSLNALEYIMRLIG